MTEDLDLYLRLGLALAIGLLVGVERGWHTAGTSGTRTIGVRTFGLIGLLGGISGWLGMLLGVVAIGAGTVALAALVITAYWLGSGASRDLGITTEVAAFAVFGLGSAAVLGDMGPAAAAAVVVTALLATKQKLHGWITRIREVELRAAIQLAIISVVILPVMPDRGFGPGEVLNPFHIWWAVVLVSGLSFAGYVAIRAAGPQLGTMITGLMGGLASSTATTWAFARMSGASPGLAPTLAVGAILAGAVTFLRILVLTEVFSPPLIAELVAPLGTMAGIAFMGAAALRIGTGNVGQVELPELRNPIDIRTALVFGGLLAVLMVAVHWTETRFGTSGVYLLAAISGLNDVDAITISMARLNVDGLSGDAAAAAIVIAASVNTVVKASIAMAAGGKKFGVRVLAVYVVTLAGGGIVLWLG